MKWIKNFFLPQFSLLYVLRVFLITGLAILCFGYLFIPCRLTGASMLPTYPVSGFNFCWRGAFWGRSIQRGDIVIIRLGDGIFALKRVVAMPGENVQFIKGKCYINQQVLPEPYCRLPSNWDMKPMTIKQDHYFVVGDNRSMPIKQHIFGETPHNRIIGKPIW